MIAPTAHMRVSHGVRLVTALLFIGIFLAGALICGAYWRTTLTPTLGIPGVTTSRDVSPADFGKRHVEGFARNWILKINNSHAANYLTHAAAALPEVESPIIDDLKTYFRNENSLYQALDRSTTADMQALEATRVGDDLWRCDYQLNLHTWYGAIDSGISYSCDLRNNYVTMV